MGIDVYLKWKGMTKKDKAAQTEHYFRHDGGAVGYLREAYHGGPYPSKILVREAFEAPKCYAKIPASVMRQRLVNVTEPAATSDRGHVVSMVMQALAKQMADGELKDGQFIKVDESTLLSGHTAPMTVEEAVRERCKVVYPTFTTENIEQLIQSYTAFVDLAEKKEKKTGQPCTVYASY